MILMVCIDDKDGMMFANRRQSQDRLLRQELLSLSENARLFLTPYSARQFSETSCFTVTENPECQAKKGDFYFVEDGALPFEQAEQIILFHWNRTYPADRCFPRAEALKNFHLVSTREFAGFSHKIITEEIWKKNP